jgi:hypothetical protein
MLSSPPKRKDTSLEELQKRLEAAEERRKARNPSQGVLAKVARRPCWVMMDRCPSLPGTKMLQALCLGRTSGWGVPSS